MTEARFFKMPKISFAYLNFDSNPQKQDGIAEGKQMFKSVLMCLFHEKNSLSIEFFHFRAVSYALQGSLKGPKMANIDQNLEYFLFCSHPIHSGYKFLLFLHWS